MMDNIAAHLILAYIHSHANGEIIETYIVGDQV